MKKFIVFIMSVSLLLPQLGTADTATTTKNDSDTQTEICYERYCTLNKVLKWLTISGYIDASYNYLLRKNVFISNFLNRFNDIEPNGFTLQQVLLRIFHQPDEGFGFYFNAMIGRDTNNLAPLGWNSYYGSQTLGFYIPQFYFQYATPHFVLMAGLFQTLAALEDYDSTSIFDSNFSRSILYGFAEPGYFTGLRAKFILNDKFNFTVTLNNGWNTIHRTGKLNSIEVGLMFTPDTSFTFAILGRTGPQEYADYFAHGPTSNRSYVNLYATIYATKHLWFDINADYGVQSKGLLAYNVLGRAVWGGVTGYINYQFNDRWLISLRGEILDDKDGFRSGVRQNWREATLTLTFTPIKKLILRAETRHDTSNVNSFITKNANKTRNNQQSYAIEGIYKF